MIPDKKLKISFQELSLMGSAIIAQQPEIHYAEALQQVLRLKKISKENQSSKSEQCRFIGGVPVDSGFDHK